MDKKLNKVSLLWGVPGIVLQHLGFFMSGMFAEPLIALFFLFLSLVGTVLLLIGLGYYAKAKGHTPVWGLMGLLSCLGILVLALLPDRNIEQPDHIGSIDELDLPDGTQSPFGTDKIEPK